MSYLYLRFNNRCFAIHQAWIEILVYGTSYYLIHSFLLKFLLNYSIDQDNNNTANNNTAKDSKIKNNSKNKIEIIRGGDDSITNEFLAAILKECFKKDVSYKITHPDLIEKIRSFLKATAAQGIKIVPISVAVIAVIHQNRNLTMLEIGRGTLMIDNLSALKKTLVKSAVKGATVALVVVGGSVLITTPAGGMAVSLIKLIGRRAIKLVPALANSPILQQEVVKLLIGGTLVLAPINKQISDAVTSLPPIQKTLTCLTIKCSDYVEELPADANQQNIKYVESYQKPDSRVIIKGSSDHIICLPEKHQTLKRTLTTINTVGGKVIVGDKSRVDKKLKASEICEVDYKVHKDRIPEIGDFNDVINVETLNKAEKMLSDANLLNEDDFNVAPKEPPIKIRNN
jgi:hypothetical protein